MRTLTLPNPVLERPITLINHGPGILHVMSAYDAVRRTQPEIDGVLTKTLKQGERIKVFSDGTRYFTAKSPSLFEALYESLLDIIENVR